MQKIRQITYPIAILEPDGLSGGKHGGGGSSRRWNHCDDSFFLEGGIDDVIIYDSDGRKFIVEKIYLSKVKAYDIVFGYLINGYDSNSVRVDMDLKQIDQLTFSQFREELLEKVLANPNWWKGRYYKKNVLKKFDASTFSELINNIEVLEPRSLPKLKGYSDKVFDNRN